VIVKTLHYDQFQKTIELHSEALQVKCFTYLTLFGIISVQQNKLDHLILLFFWTRQMLRTELIKFRI